MDIAALFTPWYNFSLGKPINTDGAYGNQCVDVVTAWSEYLWPDLRYWQTIGFGDARMLYAGASSAYFEKIPYSPGVVPKMGDIFVKKGTIGNPEGHTGAVKSATASSMQTLEQNGYNSSGVSYAFNQSYNNVIGFLRPRIGQVMQPDKYDTVPTGDDVGIHYRKRMFREASAAEKANKAKLTWSQILDDNVAELGARLKAAENSTKEYTKDGVVSYIQNKLT